MKAVKNYLKNISKSMAFATADVAKEMMPETGDFVETNKEFFTATYAALRNPTATLKKGIKSVQESKVYQAAVYGAKNTVEDLKTGNFYNKEREDRDSLKFAGLDTDWDDLSEFGIDDDWESNIGKSSGSDITAGDREVVKTVEATSAASTNTIVNATLVANDNAMKNQRISTGLLYNQNERLFGGLHKDIGILDNSIRSMHGLLATSLQNIDTNMASFFTEQLDNTKQQTAILREMLEMQRNMYKSAAQKEAEENNKQGKARYKDVASGGTPDLKAYFDMVGKNITKQFSDMGIAGFGEDSNMLAAMFTSPLKSLTTGLVKGLIPATIKATTEQLDQSINGIFGTFLARMVNARDDTLGNTNGLMKILGRFLAPNTRVSRDIDTSKYERGPVPWDGIARKTLTDVIPKYLRRIEAALTGEPEEVYDYKTGRWTTLRSAKALRDNIHKRSVQEGTAELQQIMKPGLDAVKFSSKREQDDFNQAQDEFWEHIHRVNGEFYPDRTADQNAIPPGSRIRKYYKLLCDIYKKSDEFRVSNAQGRILNRGSHHVKMQLGSRILSAKDREEAELRQMEREGGVAVQYEAVNRTSDKHGKWNKNDKGVESWLAGNRLNELKDSFGNTVYDYLRQINRELEWQRDSWLYAGGGFGGNSYTTEDNVNVTAGPNPGTFRQKRGERFQHKINLRDINSFDMRSVAKRNESENKYHKSTAEAEAYLRKVQEKVEKGEWILYDDGTLTTRTDEKSGEEIEELNEAFRAAIENVMAERASNEYIGKVNEYANQNFLTKYMSKSVYKDGIYTSKQVRDAEKQVEKEAEKKENNEEVLDEKEKSFLGTVFEKIAGGGGFVSAFSSASAESITNLLYAADESIYNMFFKTEIEGEDKTKYEGFIDMITKKTESTFNHLKDSIDKNILTPFKERFNELVDPTGEKKDRFFDTIKGAGSKAWKVFKDSNKEVYGGLFNKVKDAVNPDKIADRQSKSRADKRASVTNTMEYAMNNSNLVDDRYLQILSDYGLNFMDYSSVEDANKDLMPILQEEMYKSSNKMKDFIGAKNSNPEINAAFEYLKTHPDIAQRLANRNGIALNAENPDGVGADFVNKFGANFFTNKEVRDFRNRSIVTGNYEEYNKQTGFTGDLDEQIRRLKMAGISDDAINRTLNGVYIGNPNASPEELNQLRMNALSKMHARLARSKFAKGTFGLPFKGTSALSKNELLFNSKGVSKVNKTGVYEVTEPTHILNSEDSYEILKDLGFENLGPKSTIAQDLKKEDSAIEKITKHAGGTEKINIKGKDMTANEVLDEAKKYVPEAAAGGVLGGVVSTLLGFVGGPIIGAAVGSGVSLIAKSDKFKDILFGKTDADGNRQGGVISKAVIDTVKKYAPDAMKFGLAGIIPGLLTPLGPLGGMMIGAGIGILKNNENFTTKYFGENGKLTFNSNEKKIIQKMLPNTLIGAGVGAAATLFGGPFGLLGNAAIGAAVGMMTSTEEFKEGILGRSINGVRVGGILGGLKEAFAPIGNTMINLKDELIDIIDNKIINPLKDFADPFINALPRMAALIPSLIVRFLDRTGIRDSVMEKLGDFVKGPLAKVFGKVLSPIVKTGANLITLPFRGLGAIGNRWKQSQIDKGYRNDMTASERVDWMKEHDNTDSAAYLRDLALATSTEEDVNSMLTNTGAILNNRTSARGNLKAAGKGIHKTLRNYRTQDGQSLNIKNSDRKAIEKALNSGNMGEATRLLGTMRLSNGRTLGKEDIDILLNSDEYGLQTKFKNYATAYNINDLVNNGDKNVIEQQLSAQYETITGRKLSSNPLKRNKELKTFRKLLETESVNRKANGQPVISDEDKARIQPIIDELKQLNETMDSLKQILTGHTSGESEEVKSGTAATDKIIEDAVGDVNSAIDIREQQAIDLVGQDVWDKMDEAGKDRIRTSKRDIGYKAKQAVQKHKDGGTDPTSPLNTSPSKAVNEAVKNKKKIKGHLNTRELANALNYGDTIKRIERIKRKGYKISNEGIKYIQELNNTKYRILRKILDDRHFSAVFDGYALDVEDLKYIADRPSANRSKYLKTCASLDSHNILWYNTEGLTPTTIFDHDNSINAEIGAQEYAKSKEPTMRQKAGIALREAVSPITSQFKKDKFNIYDETGGVVPKGSAPIENVEEESEPIAQNGVGSFLLNLAGSAVKGIGKAAWSGVKGVAKNTAEMFLPEQVVQGAQGALNAAKAAKNGIGAVGDMWAASKDSGNFDETDKAGDGKDIAQVGDKFIRIETKSDGSVEPDTSDSNTKEVIDEINKEKSTNEKLAEAQLEQAENIKDAFDTSEIEGSKNGKLSWLALLFGGAILWKTGVLQKLFNNVIKPIWTEHLKPWLTEKVAPWIKDTAIPAVATAIGNLLKEILPGLIKTGVSGLGTLMSTLLGGGKDKNWGNDRTVDSTEKTGASGFYDENGNEYTYEQIAAGEAGDTVYNANGEVGTVDDNGVVTVEDTTSRWNTAAKVSAKNLTRSFLRGTSGKLVKGVSKASSKLIKAGGNMAKHGSLIKGAATSAAGGIGKIMTTPAQLGETLAKKMSGGLSKAAETAGLDAQGAAMMANIAENTADDAVEAASKSGVVSKALTKIKNWVNKGLSKLAENNKFIKRVADAATELGQDSSKFATKFINKVSSVFDEAAETACKKLGTQTLKEALEKLNFIATLVMIAVDFGTGCDQAESILEITDPTALEKVVCGAVRALCNLTIIPAIIPGENWIAQKLCGLFDSDLKSKQEETDAEYEAYIEETHSTESKDEYLKHEYSVTGKLGKKIKNAAKTVGKGFKKAGGVAVKAAWNASLPGIITNVTKKVKNFKNASKSGDSSALTEDESKTEDGSDGALTNIIKSVFIPGYGINLALKSVVGNHTKISDAFSTSDTDDKIQQVKDGKLTIFNKDYWKVEDADDEDETGFASVFNKAYNWMKRLLNSPTLLVRSLSTSLSDGLSSIGDWFSEKLSNVKSFFKHPIQFIYNKIMGNDDDDDTVDTSDDEKWWKKFGKKVKSWLGIGDSSSDSSATGSFGRGKFGRGYVKQIDPSIKNLPFNTSRDTQRQTIGNSACGPAAAVNAVKAAYGRGSEDLLSASNYALSGGYKEPNGGTYPEFFTDYFNDNGLGSTTSYDKTTIASNIRAGNPTVLMGKDSNGTSDSTPFGTSSHYVTVTGIDGYGRAIVQDPESQYDDQLYDVNDLVSKTQLGISATGLGRLGRGRFGRGYEGNIWNALTQQAGFTEAGAAGLMGNLEAESGMDPTNLQNTYNSSLGYTDTAYTNAVDNGTYTNFNNDSAGYGLAQWTYKTRKKGLYDYAKSKGSSIGNLVTQINWLLSELSSGYSGVYSTLKSTNSVSEASNAVLLNFEKPANMNSKKTKRAKMGQAWYDKYKGTTGDSIDGIDATAATTSAASSEEEDSSDSSENDTTSSVIDALSDVLLNSEAGKIYTAWLNGGDDDDSSDSSSDSSTSSSDSTVYSSDGTVTDEQNQLVALLDGIKGTIKYSMSGARDPDKGSADCSSTVNWAYKKVFGESVGNSTLDMLNNSNTVVVDKADSGMDITNGGSNSSGPHEENLEAGDILLFSRPTSSFTKGRAYRIGHVEMYYGDGKTIGHGSGMGPKIKTLASQSKKYIEAKRYKTLVSGTGSTTNPELKPISKYGTYRNNLKNTADTGSYYHNISTSGMGSERPNQTVYINNTGQGTDDSKIEALLNAIINVLTTIADNSDRLNTIANLITEYTGINTSAEAVSNATSITSTKDAITSALSTIASSSSTTNSMNNSENSSMMTIINMLNSIASE